MTSWDQIRDWSWTGDTGDKRTVQTQHKCISKRSGACGPSRVSHLLSNARAWAGWHTMHRLQSQKWSLSLGLLWRPGCFLWSTWELEFDPAARSCPWLPGLLCLETLGWWKQITDNQISAFALKACWNWINADWARKVGISLCDFVNWRQSSSAFE